MRSIAFKVLLSSATAISGVAVSASWAQETAVLEEPATETEDVRSRLDTVTVTAQRREQNLQDVPVAVTALSEEALQTNRIANLGDLTGLAPSLNIVPTAGGTGSPTLTMRGLTALGAAPGADRGISMYIDGVFQGVTTASLLTFADLERVEVLRGPQGTLFGRNATGGALSFITRNPSGEFGFEQTFTVGNRDTFESRTRLETDQFGPFSAILNFTHIERQGDTRNLGAGTVLDFSATGGGTFVSPEYLGDEDSNAISVAVAADFHEKLDLIYKFDHSQRDFTPEAHGLLGVGPEIGASYEPTLAFFGIEPTPVSIERPDAVNNAFSTEGEAETTGHILTATYDLTDDITLKNILGYREHSNRTPSTQLDGLGGFPVVGVFVSSNEVSSEQFSNEFQMIYNTDLVTVTGGLLYYSMDQVFGGYADHANGTFGSPDPTMPSIFPNPVAASDTDVEVTSKAIYSQTELHVSDKLDVLFGARYTEDEKNYLDNSLFISAFTGPLDISFEDEQWTYLAGLNYKPTSDSSVYAKYSTGFISGGQLAGLAFEPEKAESFEVGFKADWLGGTYRTNVSAYHVEYTNLQTAVSGIRLATPVLSGQVLVNASDGVAQGIEFEGFWVPTDNLSLSGNFGYTDFEFENVDVSIFGQAPAEQYKPEWTANMTANYTSDPLFDDVRLDANITANYKGDHFVTATEGDVALVNELDGNWLVNARAGLGGFKIGGAEAEFSVWGRNITDNKDPINSVSLVALSSVLYTPGQTYGADMKIKF